MFIDGIGIMVEGDTKQAYKSLLRELQLIVDDTIDTVAANYRNKPLEASNWVAIIILKRLVESTKAGEVLIIHQFDRDASILLTNQIELRLDLEYVSRDHNRANAWLNHTNSHSKPWKVRSLFEQLFEKEELKAEKEVYMRFSMVKHGNPVAETFGFPLAIRGSHLLIPPQEDILLAKFSIYVFSFFSQLYRAYKAAVVDFRRCGLDVTEQENKADFINMAMSDLNTKSFYEQVHVLQKISPKPDLCDSCRTFPQNTIEVTCLLHRIKQADRFTCERYVPV